MDLSAAALPVSVLKPLAATSGGSASGVMDEAAKRAQIASKAKDYEATFLSMMFGQMMEGTTPTMFGGGQGEESFKSFMTDAMAKSMVRHGGIGLAKALTADMLKLQGLSPTPTVAASGAGAAKPAAPPTPSAKPQLDIAA
jgi:Rod binding domain-containing protein